MRTMSPFETGHATGQVSLQGLLGDEPARSQDTGIRVADLASRVVVGGWPGHLTLAERDAIGAAADDLQELHRSEIQRLDDGRRDPRRVTSLVRAIARHVATPAPAAALARDAGGPTGPLDRDTVARYLEALDRLMITEDQPAWTPHLRSRSRARTAPKRHSVDPSPATAALGATPARLLRDVETLGSLFESLAVRDLRVYAQSFGATVLNYRDDTGLEVDAIVEAKDGIWAAFEIKLGQARLDEAAANLLEFSARVDHRRVGQPSRLTVVTGTGYAYDRPDGVAVVPIGALGPQVRAHPSSGARLHATAACGSVVATAWTVEGLVRVPALPAAAAARFTFGATADLARLARCTGPTEAVSGPTAAPGSFSRRGPGTTRAPGRSPPVRHP